jgi:hypothetical protein
MTPPVVEVNPLPIVVESGEEKEVENDERMLEMRVRDMTSVGHA